MGEKSGQGQPFEQLDKKYYKKNPEKIPENQIIISNFRNNMIPEYLNQFKIPLEQKKEKELLEPFIKETIAELGLIELKNQYHHCICFADLFLQTLEQLANEIKYLDIKKMLRTKYNEIEDWIRRVNQKYQTPKFKDLKEDAVNEIEYQQFFQNFVASRNQIINDLEEKRIWQFLEKNEEYKQKFGKTPEKQTGPPVIGQFSAEFHAQEDIPIIIEPTIIEKNDENDSNEEDNEFTVKTKNIGHRYLEELIPSMNDLATRRFSRNMANQTQKIGKQQESTLVEDFWNYYQKFSENKQPDPSEYFGKQEAELKISVLIDIFQDFYLESVYPITNRIPIIHYRFLHNDPQKPNATKIFLVADTHGSFKDTQKLIKLFVKEIESAKKGNREIKVIFIGDYIDRSPFDIHNLLYIMTFNLKFPSNVLLLRGNHEEMTVNANYGFGNNTIKYFSKLLYASFNNFFKDLPLIAMLHFSEGNIAVLHGGIPLLTVENTVDPSVKQFEVPDLQTWDFQNRHVNLEELDPVTSQILWNDPIDGLEENEEVYYPNGRGMGFKFGKAVFNAFCEKNKINLVFRGHQVFQDGISRFFDDRFISFFSAHEYGKSRIKAKYIEINSANIYNYLVKDIQEIK